MPGPPTDRQRRDASADVDRDALELIADPFTFACVEAHPDLQAELAYSVDRGEGAQRIARPGPSKGREEPIAGRIDFATPEARNELTKAGPLGGEELRPAAVTELHRPVRRVHDVGEESTVARIRCASLASSMPGRDSTECDDRAQDGVRVAGDRHVVLAGQLDIARVRATGWRHSG